MHRFTFNLGLPLALAALPAVPQRANRGRSTSMVGPQTNAARSASQSAPSVYARNAFSSKVLGVPKYNEKHEGKERMVSHTGQKNYDCALSFTIGDELKADRYKGAKLFGQTHALSSLKRKAGQ